MTNRWTDVVVDKFGKPYIFTEVSIELLDPFSHLDEEFAPRALYCKGKVTLLQASQRKGMRNEYPHTSKVIRKSANEGN